MNAYIPYQPVTSWDRLKLIHQRDSLIAKYVYGLVIVVQNNDYNKQWKKKKKHEK